MNNSDPFDSVPKQEKGASTDTEYSYTADSMEEAKQLYIKAKQRLVSVNHWEKYCGQPSAEFTLTDSSGNEIKREARDGDHFRIDIPGPGSVTGEGYDWVRVESIFESTSDDGRCDSLSIRVRPSTNPANTEQDVAHFFSHEATSNFIVRRDDNTVTAGVYGRNEIPNTEAEHLVDKARNATIGLSAAAGVSKFQWQKLVKGLVGKGS